MRSHRLHRLIICLVAVIVIIVTAVKTVNTVEIPSEVSVIHPLPADWNPYQRLYDEMLYPVVRIESASGIGSGVIIHRRDAEDAEKSIYILSAGHVVGNQSAVTVTLYSYISNTQTTLCDLCAFVVMTDTNKDLALLRVLSVSAVNTAKLAPKDYTPFIFTPIWTVGCSLGLPPRPSFGHITAIVSHQDTKTPSNSLWLSALVASHWEISAPILPGNSGGPVYNANTHEVIGIAVWVHTYYGQLITTMAGIVPIQTVYEFLESYKQ